MMNGENVRRGFEWYLFLRALFRALDRRHRVGLEEINSCATFNFASEKMVGSRDVSYEVVMFTVCRRSK